MITKLKISKCTIGTNGPEASTDTADQFVVMLNPSKYKQDYEISYSDDCTGEIPQGTAKRTPNFVYAGKEGLKFDIVIDGTGVAGNLEALKESAMSAANVVGSALNRAEPVFDDVSDVHEVYKQIEKLKALVYDYDGDKHQPNIVQLLWGNLTFYGRLTSMSVEYTLFKPTGYPLRANVGLGFIEYTSVVQEQALANRQSPDLTHLVEVKAGDSLPLLCFRIYQNSAYYLEVAKSNGITNFRDIKPGTRLNFPPLR